MRKFTVLLACVLASCAFASAQMQPPKAMEIPKTELYLGYAYQHADTSGINAQSNGLVTTTSTNLNGFAFGFAEYFPSRLGFMVDISRVSNKAVDSTGIKYLRTTYLGGPTYRLHNIGFFTPSVHVLGGFEHDDFTVPEIGTVIDYRNLDAAATAGVTFDANMSRHIAVRLGQIDYLYTHHYANNQSSFRYSGGVVFRF